MECMPSAKPKGTETLRENEKKWGKELLAPGWTLIPNVLLSKQHALGLDPVDINLLLQILKHWWHADEAPFPSQKTLARSMNVHVSTVKRHLADLRDAGLISWEARNRADGGRASNRYDFSGLIRHARPYAAEEVEAKRAAAEERKARRARKRARRGPLRVVKGEP